MLDAGAGDADRIDFLKGIAADSVAGNLAGYDHQRNRIHIGGGDSGYRVGCSRSGGDQANTRFAGSAGIAVRGVGRTLFVAHQDVHDVILFL